MSIIIGIDHGYYAIKTAHCSFPAGLTSYGEHEPYTRQGLLEFGGCFFVCGTGRQPIQRDKIINDNYYLLTLAVIAKEIRQRGLPPECSVRIAAGLPLTSFGRDKPKFRDYLLRSKQPVNFRFEGVEYRITINNVGFWDSIPLWAVTLIGGLLITVLSFTMILTVYGRMFSLWMYAAIAPIPLSTFAGEPTSSVGKNFIRSYAGVCLQGVVIALSCIIFSAISSSPPAVDTGASVVTAVWTYVGELAFNLLVLVGAIKGCDRIVKEIMGL